jgi:L,D-peptidoglycan transpeptidase YkuD (ErfK/YbiS/YcfS/YnhG family)
VKRKRRLQGRSPLYVAARPGTRTQGILRFRGHAIRVALGRGGIRANKFEGDGATPRGRFRMLRLWWRADRAPRPRTHLPVRAIRADDGWCEDPDDRRYNRPIRLAEGTPGDRLRRDDSLYDFIIEIDHNTRPRIGNRGSAVFIHVARPDFVPTTGCVAMKRADLQRLLPSLSAGSSIAIG